MRFISVRSEGGFTLTELMVTVAIIGLLAAIALPTFSLYVKKTKSTEPRVNLKRMLDGVYTYHLAEHQDSPGFDGNDYWEQTLAPYLPPTPTLGTCCSQGGRCNPDAQLWQGKDWQIIQFSMEEPHYYSYEYYDDRRDQTVYIEAHGDLDCDGKYGTYKVRAKRDESTGNVTRAAHILSFDPME